LSEFKLKTQLELLVKYHFDPSIEGMRTMETAVAAHLVDSPSVGKRGKELYLLIMGDII